MSGHVLSQFVVCGVVVIVDGGKILVETKQGLQLHFLAFGLTTFEPLHGDATRINIDARNNSRMDATVTPFDVDVDAHLDAAEDLVLRHGHLHNDGDLFCESRSSLNSLKKNTRQRPNLQGSQKLISNPM